MMKKQICNVLALILACLMILPAACGETAAAGPAGTWTSRRMAMDGQDYVVVESSVTFYENGTYNGTILQMYPISGEWIQEDEMVIMEDATGILEDADNMTLYYGEYEFRFERKKAAEGPSAAEAAEAAATLLTGCWDRIDEVFGRSIRAMEAVRQFISDGQYESLLQARILCSEVMALTGESIVPENPFDSFDAEVLNELGVDAGNTGILTGMCRGAESDARIMISFCMQYLFQDYCYTDLGNMINAYTEGCEQYFRSVGRMQPLLARIILDGLWEEPVMVELWASIPENWPVPGENLPENTDFENIQTLFLEENDRTALAYEDSQNQLNSCLSVLQEKEDSIAAGNYEPIRSVFDLPGSLPPIVPLPDMWFDTERVLLQTEGSGTRGKIPEEAVLSVLMTDREEYAGFMNLMLPMIAEGTALEGSKQDGWHCEVRNNLFSFRSEWDPGTGTAFFRYDPSGMTLERISINNMLLELFRPGD